MYTAYTAGTLSTEKRGEVSDRVHHRCDDRCTIAQQGLARLHQMAPATWHRLPKVYATNRTWRHMPVHQMAPHSKIDVTWKDVLQCIRWNCQQDSAKTTPLTGYTAIQYTGWHHAQYTGGITNRTWCHTVQLEAPPTESWLSLEIKDAGLRVLINGSVLSPTEYAWTQYTRCHQLQDRVPNSYHMQEVVPHSTPGATYRTTCEYLKVENRRETV